jgi:2-oxo-3-(phosphooxy)propyl 3-oxoalkanoate synthase
MTVTETFERVHPPAPVGFAQTVDRALVHRASVAEVFVTDMCRVDDTRYLAAAQLPLSHGYYSDHPGRARFFDSLLVLESSRQAAVYGAHRFLDVPLSTAFLVKNLAIDLDGPDALAAGSAPGELRLLTTYPEVQVRSGQVRRVRVKQDLYLGTRYVGGARMEVGAMSKAEHHALRLHQRGAHAPSTADLRATVRQSATKPERVGRTSPTNVVIADPEHGPDGVTARLEPRFDNRSLFDHDYDHYPAATMLEAARQVVLLHASAADREIRSANARFLRFAELDAPVLVTSTRGDGPDAFAVRFTQQGAVIAELGVQLAEVRA